MGRVIDKRRAAWADYLAMLAWLYGDVEERMLVTNYDLVAWRNLGRR